jgi:hypothetical protein
MRNRIITFLGEGRNSMEENKNIEELLESIKTSEGYMLTLTTVNGTKLEHSLIIKNFDKLNMLASHKEIKDLIIKQLESETTESK